MLHGSVGGVPVHAGICLLTHLKQQNDLLVLFIYPEAELSLASGVMGI